MKAMVSARAGCADVIIRIKDQMQSMPANKKLQYMRSTLSEYKNLKKTPKKQ